MGDNTAGWTRCPDCGVLIDRHYAHACPGTPWQQVTLSPFTQTVDAETKDYLRRIAEALEALVNLMTPRKVEVPPQNIQHIDFIGDVVLTPLKNDAKE